MREKFDFWLLWLLLTVTLTAGAVENPVFDHLSTAQGLSQGNITALAQDRHGFIWVGTQEGLNRYDGRTIKRFVHSHSDPGSLSHDYISDLLVDSAGQLWVATMGGGLLRFDERKQRFSTFSSFGGDATRMNSTRIRLLYEDDTGVIWVGTDSDGLYWIDHKRSRLGLFRHHEDDPTSVADNRIRAIESDIQGRLWVGTEGGGLSLLDQPGQRFEHFRHNPDDPESLGSNNIMSLFAASDGTIWVGTYDSGLSILNPFRRKVSRFIHDPADFYSIAAQRIRDISMDESGRIWLATDGGLNLWDPDRRGFHTYEQETGVANSLSDNRVTTLMQDAGGVLWVGTYSGLNKWNARIGSVEHYRVLPDSPRGLSSGVVTSFAEDPSGGLWIGTWGGGLNRMDSAGTEVSVRRAEAEIGSLSDDRVMSMLVDSSNRLWVGTLAHGLDRLDPDADQFVNLQHDPEVANSLSSNAITRIFEDSGKRIWVGTFGGGVNRLTDNGFAKLMHDPADANSLGSDRVLDIKQTSDESIWFATDGGGVSILSLDSEQMRSIRTQAGAIGGLSSDSVITLLMTESDIWLGTKDAGLDRLPMSDYLAGNYRFINYNRQTGLPSNAVLGLLQDDTGMIWVATNQGISALAPESDTIRNFTVAHGLQGDEFNSGAYFKSVDGTLYFGGNNGFNRFNPRNLLLSTNSFPAPVVLIGLTVFGKPYDGEETLQDLKQLTLGYNDSVVGFEFAALDYTKPAANRYQYRLEGLEQVWNRADSNNRATYTNLAPGSYTFRARAANNDGYWSGKELAIDLIIAAPPWRSWWAYTIEVAVALLAIYTAMRLVSSRARRRAEQQANERMRMYIACLEEASDAVAIANPKGRLIYANKALDHMVPVTGEQTSTLKDRLFTDSAEATQAMAVVNADGHWRGEVSHPLGGDERTLDVFLTRVEHFLEGETPIIAVARDISERKQSELVLGRYRDRLEILVHKRTQELESEIRHHQETEDRLRLSLAEKELLLKEVHHRVKNNMQVISSLLNIQSEGSELPELVDALSESQNRIRSMALIHESLYQSDNLLEIDFNDYVRQLTNTLVRVWALPNVEIIVEINAKNVFLDIDKAVPCGLIINELVSNSLKHAFKDRRGRAALRVDFERKEAYYQIRVSDDGVGFPEGLDFRNTPSLGMEIVCVLTTQLEGKIEIERKDGTCFTITFPSEQQEAENA